MLTLRSPAKAGVHAASLCDIIADLGSSRDQQDLVPEPPFKGQIVETFHIYSVDVVVGNDR